MAIRGVVTLSLLLAACTAADPSPTILSCTNPVTGCAMPIDGGTASLRFSETPVSMRPFDLELITAAEKIEASFQMQGMDMGLNRYRLQSVESTKWNARVILPVCMQGRGDWVLQLNITQAGKSRLYQVPFKSG